MKEESLTYKFGNSEKEILESVMAVNLGGILMSNIIDISDRAIAAGDSKDCSDASYISMYKDLNICAKTLKNITNDDFLENQKRLGIVVNKFEGGFTLLSSDKELIKDEINFFGEKLYNHDDFLSKNVPFVVTQDTNFAILNIRNIIEMMDKEENAQALKLVEVLINSYQYDLGKRKNDADNELKKEEKELEEKITNIQNQFETNDMSIYMNFGAALEQSIKRLKNINKDEYNKYHKNGINAESIVRQVLDIHHYLLNENDEKEFINPYILGEIDKELGSYFKKLDNYIAIRIDDEEFEDLKLDFYEYMYEGDEKKLSEKWSNEYIKFEPDTYIIDDEEIVDIKYPEDNINNYHKGFHISPITINQYLNDFLNFDIRDINDNILTIKDEMLKDIEQQVSIKKLKKVNDMLVASFIKTRLEDEEEFKNSELYGQRDSDEYKLELIRSLYNSEEVFKSIYRHIPRNKKNTIIKHSIAKTKKDIEDIKFEDFTVDNIKAMESLNQMILTRMEEISSMLDKRNVPTIDEEYQFRRVTNFLTNIDDVNDVRLANSMELADNYYKEIQAKISLETQKIEEEVKRINEELMEIYTPDTVFVVNDVMQELKSVNFLENISEEAEAPISNILYEVCDKELRKNLINFNGKGKVKTNITSEDIKQYLDEHIEELDKVGADAKKFENSFFIKTLNKEISDNLNKLIKSEKEKGKKLKDIKASLVMFDKIQLETEELVSEDLTEKYMLKDTITNMRANITNHIEKADEFEEETQEDEKITAFSEERGIDFDDKFKDLTVSKICISYPYFKDKLKELIEIRKEVDFESEEYQGHEENDDNDSIDDYKSYDEKNLFAGYSESLEEKEEREEENNEKYSEITSKDVGMLLNFENELLNFAETQFSEYFNNCKGLERKPNIIGDDIEDKLEKNRVGLLLNENERNKIFSELHKINDDYKTISLQGERNFKRYLEQNSGKKTAQEKFTDDCIDFAKNGENTPEKYTKLSFIEKSLIEFSEDTEDKRGEIFTNIIGRCTALSKKRREQLKTAINRFSPEAKDIDLERTTNMIERSLIIGQIVPIFTGETRDDIKQTMDIPEAIRLNLKRDEIYNNLRNKEVFETMLYQYSSVMIKFFENGEFEDLEKLGKKFNVAENNFSKALKTQKEVSKIKDNMFDDVISTVEEKQKQEEIDVTKQILDISRYKYYN